MTSVADRASSQSHDRYLTRMSAYLRAMFPVGTRVLTPGPPSGICDDPPAEHHGWPRSQRDMPWHCAWRG